MKNDFVSSARSVSDLKAHLVLTTKYRQKVLTGEMISRLGDIINDLCQKWDCKVIEFNAKSRIQKKVGMLSILHQDLISGI